MTFVSEIDGRLLKIEAATAKLSAELEETRGERSKVDKTLSAMRVALLTDTADTADMEERTMQAEKHRDDLQRRVDALRNDLTALNDEHGRLTEERKVGSRDGAWD